MTFIRRRLWEARQWWRRLGRPKRPWPFRTTGYAPEQVTVRCGHVEITKGPGDRFPHILIDGVEQNWKSFTLSQRVADTPLLLVVETVVK